MRITESATSNQFWSIPDPEQKVSSHNTNSHNLFNLPPNYNVVLNLNFDVQVITWPTAKRALALTGFDLTMKKSVTSLSDACRLRCLRGPPSTSTPSISLEVEYLLSPFSMSLLNPLDNLSQLHYHWNCRYLLTAINGQVQVKRNCLVLFHDLKHVSSHCWISYSTWHRPISSIVVVT